MRDNHEGEEAKKLACLRAAALVGTLALDRGAFKEFADASALIGHLDKLADAALGKSADAGTQLTVFNDRA
jgi:antitoxin ParD1/3/4